MKFTEEQQEMIIDFGALGYLSKKISSILELDKQLIKSFFKDKSSLFFQLYNKGQLLADYKIDKKLFNLALTGDLKALDKLEIRKSLRKKKKVIKKQNNNKQYGNKENTDLQERIDNNIKQFYHES